MPHKGINNKIPYKCLYGEDIEIDFDRFSVFGCQVYFYVPGQFKKKKFSGNSLPDIFLGYDERNPTAYRIYDINNNKIILSRAVEFFEDVPDNIEAPNMKLPEEDFTSQEREDIEVFQINYNKNSN